MLPMQEVRACSCDSLVGWEQVWCLILCQPDWTTGYSDLAKHILGVSLRTFLDKINIWICRLSKAIRLPSPKWEGLFLPTEEQKGWVTGNFYLISWAVTLLFSGLQIPPETSCPCISSLLVLWLGFTSSALLVLRHLDAVGTTYTGLPGSPATITVMGANSL